MYELKTKDINNTRELLDGSIGKLNTSYGYVEKSPIAADFKAVASGFYIVLVCAIIITAGSFATQLINAIAAFFWSSHTNSAYLNVTLLGSENQALIASALFAFIVFCLSVVVREVQLQEKYSSSKNLMQQIDSFKNELEKDRVDLTHEAYVLQEKIEEHQQIPLYKRDKDKMVEQFVEAADAYLGTSNLYQGKAQQVFYLISLCLIDLCVANAVVVAAVTRESAGYQWIYRLCRDGAGGALVLIALCFATLFGAQYVLFSRTKRKWGVGSFFASLLTTLVVSGLILIIGLVHPVITIAIIILFAILFFKNR